ncbi:MAG: YceI family protein [Chloroflexi bacterium]|nr:YceI family protein [Chloroflexota bacterium]
MALAPIPDIPPFCQRRTRRATTPNPPHTRRNDSQKRRRACCKSKVNVEIKAASVNTRDEKHDAHLRSADFLDAEKYPKITFKNKRGEMVDATHGRLVGDLTIRDVTCAVILDVEHLGKAKGPWGATSAGFAAHASHRINCKSVNWFKEVLP